MKKNLKKRIRPIVQITFFLIILATVIGKSLSEAGIDIPFFSEASLHALCPFGGVVSLYNLIVAGTLVQKIHASSVILMYAVLFLSILFGPVFCGWICPFGTFQEYIGKIGKKIFGKKYNNMLPKKLDNLLRYIRYIVLIFVIYNTATTAKLLFQNFDPYYALFNFFTNEVALSAYIVLAVTVLLSLLIERPFCKYMCPYGATLGVFNLFRIFKIRRKKDTCINCKACDKACPMNIETSSKDKVLNHQCITCMKCSSESSCPMDNTVHLSAKKDKFKISILALSIITVLILLGTIITTTALGLWKTTNSKIPSTYKSGQFAGQYNPSDIRGSYTFFEISEIFKIPLDDLGNAFGIENKDEFDTFACKDLETLYVKAKENSKEVGTSSVKIFVALYKGLPIDLDENAYFPETAEPLLLTKANLTDEQKQYVIGHLVEVEKKSAAPSSESKTEENSSFIKGKTTFKEVLALGVNKEELESSLGKSITDTSMVIKYYCEVNGLEFSKVKEDVQKLIDSK